jgi:hypothetical protein
MASGRHIATAAAVGSAAAALASCGGGARTVAPPSSAARQSTAIYATKWEPAFRLNRSGRRIVSISRTTRRLTLEIVDHTCHPGDPRFADAGRRFARARIVQQTAAVIITVFMHPEPNPPRACVPAGIGFSKTVALPHPLGPRALVDGGNPKLGGGGVLAVIRVPATSGKLERRAEAQFGPPDLGPIP